MIMIMSHFMRKYSELHSKDIDPANVQLMQLKFSESEQKQEIKSVKKDEAESF